MSTLEAFRRLYPSDYHERFLKENLRPDGRKPLDTRQIQISTGSISTAYGSSMVKMGGTAVVAGVQAELAFEDLTVPSQLIINVEVGGISGTNFSGKPDQATQALATRLRNVAASCDLVRNMADLHVESEDTRVLWYLIVDIYCLDHDGNLFDCCLTALIAALKNVRLPVGTIENGRVIGSPERPLRLEITEEYPVALSFSTFQSHLLADPSHEEESLAESLFSIVGSADGRGKLWQIYKAGGVPLNDEKLRAALTHAQSHFMVVADLIAKSAE